MNSKGPNTQSLRYYAQERLLREMIASADIESAKKGSRPTGYILVLDEYTLSIVNSIVEMKELIDLKIVGIEKIQLKRKAFPKLQAIYFLEPQESNLRSVEQDVHAKLYESIHLYFTRTVPDTLFGTLKSMPEVVKRLASFKELNLDFLVVDDCQFTLNMPGEYTRLFAATDSSLLSSVAEKLYTLVSVFLPTCSLEVVSERGSLGERVATQVMQMFRSIHGRQPGVVDSKARGIKLVVLDRGFDIKSAVIHEMFFQSMVYDLTNIKNNTVEFESETAKGERVARKCVLDERDELWLNYRFKHIAEVANLHAKK